MAKTCYWQITDNRKQKKENFMPTLSNYWFKDTDFRGETTYLSTGHPPGGWS